MCIGPATPSCWSNYANVLIEQARNIDALPLLEKVCELRPQQAIGWIKLAECCYLLSLHDKGFEASQKAAALAETLHDRVAALMQSSIHRRELGQVHEAVKDCETAIGLRPNDPGNLHQQDCCSCWQTPRWTPPSCRQRRGSNGATFEPPLQPEVAQFCRTPGIALEAPEDRFPIARLPRAFGHVLCGGAPGAAGPAAV